LFFLFGVLATLVAVLVGIPPITGMAIFNDAPSHVLMDDAAITVPEIATNGSETTQITAFQNINASVIGARCEENWVQTQRFKWPYTCTLFYNSTIALRQIGPSGSMWPALEGGGYVLFTNISRPDQLSTGDIIIFSSRVDGKEIEIVHRIIAVNESAGLYFYTTKGDNNTVQDPEQIRFEDIVGKVIGVLY
jgi:hypothetical protein